MNNGNNFEQYYDKYQNFNQEDTQITSADSQYFTFQNRMDTDGFDLEMANFAPAAFTPPASAPPSFIPNREITAFRVDPGSIRNCLNRFTYIWQDNGNEFWMFPVQVGRNSVSGFRWNRRFGWSFFGLSLDRIDAFMCTR